jgi:hypothetical protein
MARHMMQLAGIGTAIMALLAAFALPPDRPGLVEASVPAYRIPA